MNIRELTRDELKTVYETEMVYTFPPAELKPFAAMEDLLDRGCYRPLGLFEDGTLVSYLLLWTDPSGKYALGDYLGTVASRRNSGLGAQFLQMVFSDLEFKCILGEAEAPDSGDPETDALRRRRLAFYERNGLRYLNYDCALFGVHYRCLVYGDVTDEEALAAHRNIYAAQFTPERMERFIQLPLKPGEAVKPATAWAEDLKFTSVQGGGKVMPEQNKNVTNVCEVLSQMGITGRIEAEKFKCAEDGTDYEVWKVTDGQMRYVLKKEEKNEASVYRTFLADAESGVPRLYRTLHREDGDYLLMEYVNGEDLRRCDRRSLTAALDALIRLQDQFWERRELQIAGCGFEADLQSRKNRGNYLHDSDLERAYGVFLEMFAEQPQTLCHDDLLPFNILEADGRAVIIDWEYAGIMPYLTSFARLIAHGKEDPDAFFYMKEADRAFAIEYYYEHLAQKKGIAYEDYRKALDYFLLYEYCEWVMIGVKYGDTKSERYLEYFAKAKEHAKKLL